MSVRRVLLSLALAGALAAAACGDPPDKEMQQAQSAIDSAREAGAAEYAHDEFAGAEDALKRARDAVDQRDYRLALNNALDARERAQNAAKEATDKKNAARANAERELLDAMTALNEAHAKLRAAETSRVPPRTLAGPKREIAGSEEAVQKARAAFDKGDYPAALTASRQISARLRTTADQLTAASAAGAKRRR
jgi:hypothetical protein